MRTFGTQNKQRQVADAKRLRSKSMLNQSMKKRSFIRIISVVFFSCMLTLSIAHAGNDKNKEKKGKPDKEHVKKDHNQKDKAMNDSDDDEGHKKDRDHKGKNEHGEDDHNDDDGDDEDSKGLDKQKQKKSESERKELGKGSEQGQASREEHSRKWWKFWE